MTKIDIFSGFLGAGKTTLIRKLIKEAYAGQKIVLIENEFGEIAIDGGFLKDAGVQITEMNSGCICCTLVGDFKAALEKVIDQYAPDRIIIEPSGVGKLSDVAKAVSTVAGKAELGAKVTVVDANKCKMYIRNFGEFFNDQVKNADVIVLSRTGDIDEKKLLAAVGMLQELNPDAVIITTPWDKLSGAQFTEAMEHRSTLAAELAKLAAEEDDDDDDDDDECECHHHHDHDEDHDEHEHHHHDHDEDHDEHEHHHHDHDDGHDEHEHHHHHHHADDVFASWGSETPRRFTEDELKSILSALDDTEKYGMILRAKGMVDASDGQWLYFDYVPGEADIRRGAPIVTGRFCVIGSKIDESALKELFGIE
jgi:G3E family GTPase